MSFIMKNGIVKHPSVWAKEAEERSRLEAEVVKAAREWRHDMTRAADAALVKAVKALEAFEAEQEKR